MKIVVYKGFNLEFLRNQKVEPLVNNDFKYKLNYLIMDDNYKNQIMMAILSNINTDKEFFEVISQIHKILKITVM